jgi:hypothetical protein
MAIISTICQTPGTPATTKFVMALVLVMSFNRFSSAANLAATIEMQ